MAALICFPIFSNTQPSTYLCSSYTLTLPHRALSVYLPHMKQCNTLKFICFSSGEQTSDNYLYQLCPYWNPKHLPNWPSSAPGPLQPQTTEDSALLHGAVSVSTETLLSFGRADNSALWQPDCTIIFYSTGPRLLQIIQSQPPFLRE